MRGKKEFLGFFGEGGGAPPLFWGRFLGWFVVVFFSFCGKGASLLLPGENGEKRTENGKKIGENPDFGGF